MNPEPQPKITSGRAPQGVCGTVRLQEAGCVPFLQDFRPQAGGGGSFGLRGQEHQNQDNLFFGFGISFYLEGPKPTFCRAPINTVFGSIKVRTYKKVGYGKLW